MIDIINKLTLAEKVQLVSGASLWRTQPIEGASIPEMKVSDGPNGVRGDGGVAAASFPVGICMASTWNTALVEKCGTAIAEEAKTKGVQVVLGPTINIHRTPLGGRNFECYSEDPYLSGILASSFTDGVQAEGIGACVKHFVCNDSEFERHTISVEVDERTLREIYLRPFEIAIKRSNPWTIMASYNRINGVYACSHDKLVNQVLKGEWGYDGLVISDWFAAKETVPNALGGLDLEMPGPAIAWGDKLLAAVEAGEVEEALLDEKISRLLRTMQRTGLFDDVSVTPEVGINKPAHKALTYQAAIEGMVLVKNNGLLPLETNDLKKVALIGPNVSDYRIMGGGSSALKPHYVSTPLDALAEKFPQIETTVASGCRTHKYIPEADRELLSPGAGANATGLRCRFFENGLNGTEISERVIARGTLMLQGLGSIGGDAAIAEGQLTPKISGVHEFGLLSTGKAKMYLDGELLIDNWDNTTQGDAFFTQGTTEKTGQRELKAGQSYELKIEFEADLQNTFRALRYGILPPDLEGGIENAVALAKASDAVILMVGTNDDWETEGNDKEMLALPGMQNELIKQVIAANPKTVVVNNSGSPVAMPWLDEAPAVIQTWFAGQEFGNALVDLISGAANPSGKLPITFPRRLEDTPAFTSYPGEFGKVHYGEGLYVGYRWYDSRDIEPLLAFGHGLSYSDFSFSDLAIDGSGPNQNLTFSIANTSERTGQEVAQVYVEPISPTVARPHMELKAFTKVEIAAGERKQIQIALDADAFAYWDLDKGAWHVAPGDYRIHVGNSSVNLPLSGMVSIS